MGEDTQVTAHGGRRPGLCLITKSMGKRTPVLNKAGSPQGGAHHVQPVPIQTRALEGPGKVVMQVA